MTSKEWEKYLLWGLALLSVGGVAIFIWDDQKKKKLGAGGGGGAGTAPTHAPVPPPPPPPATLPFTTPTTPFGQGGTPVSFPSAGGTDFGTFVQQVQPGTTVTTVYTVQTTQTGAAGALRSHVEPDVNSPVNGSFAHGAQVSSVGEAPRTAADGSIWTHIMGTDAQTGVPLLGWVNASYLGA